MHQAWLCRMAGWCQSAKQIARGHDVWDGYYFVFERFLGAVIPLSIWKWFITVSAFRVEYIGPTLCLGKPRKHTHTHTHTHRNKCAHTCTYPHARTSESLHTYTRVYTDECTSACTHIHASKHTPHAVTNTHTHTHTRAGLQQAGILLKDNRSCTVREFCRAVTSVIRAGRAGRSVVRWGTNKESSEAKSSTCVVTSVAEVVDTRPAIVN